MHIAGNRAVGLVLVMWHSVWQREPTTECHILAGNVGDTAGNPLLSFWLNSEHSLLGTTATREVKHTTRRRSKRLREASERAKSTSKETPNGPVSGLEKVIFDHS